MNINKINLNLLIALDALLLENSVSEAAKRCHVTQAAMSNTLKQLRSVLNDPLFIRQSKKLKPTPMAIELKPKVKHALASIENVFLGHSFDPSKSERSIELSLSDHGEHLILPHLQRYLRQHAPNMQIHIHEYTGTDRLQNSFGDEICIAIANIKPGAAQICCQTLFEEEGICVMNKRHQLANKRLTAKAYSDAQHVALNYNPNAASSFIDDILEKLQIPRTIAIYVPRLTTAMNLILNDNQLIGTFPAKLFHGHANSTKLVSKKVPFEIPLYPMHLIWHSRLNHDPGTQWVIDAIVKITKTAVSF